GSCDEHRAGAATELPDHRSATAERSNLLRFGVRAEQDGGYALEVSGWGDRRPDRSRCLAHLVGDRQKVRRCRPDHFEILRSTVATGGHEQAFAHGQFATVDLVADDVA